MVGYLSYERRHLTGVIALCEAEGWRSFTAMEFYASFAHRRWAGFRVYPLRPDSGGTD